MKLTANQIEYVFNYVASKDIKWYELQLELTDHLVTSMEKYWSEDPLLTFQQVKHRAEEDFYGYSSFKSIEEERMKSLRKQFRNQHWKRVQNYLKFPKILGSVFLVLLSYKVSFYFADVVLYLKILASILLVFSSISIINWFRFRKLDGKQFLNIQTAFQFTSNTILLSYFMILGAKNWSDYLTNNQILLFIICCVWVLALLFIFAGKHLTDEIVLDTKKKYQLI